MKNILEAKELSKTYVISKENHKNVLKNVDLQIKEGEFVSVMGPSGSGKSTLLYNISGMDRMTSGSVIFNEEDLSVLCEEELSRLRLNNMGFIFQHIHLLKNLNILDNIILPSYLAKSNSRKSIKKRAIELMEKSGISELANNDVTQASGGQLQRVGICRALINNPDIIFGDEPTGALNSKAADEIMDILADINRTGTTILLVTHDIKVAAKAERVIFMLDGEIVDEQYLGKSENNIKTREKNLSTWLTAMGF
ncbi:MAG: ABC transporter ATP-binding protein [Halanaerobiales bacterium]|nr:ABC transporter ATP-binding protein [Halanaerobiales bacterium]